MLGRIDLDPVEPVARASPAEVVLPQQRAFRVFRRPLHRNRYRRTVVSGLEMGIASYKRTVLVDGGHLLIGAPREAFAGAEGGEGTVHTLAYPGGVLGYDPVVISHTGLQPGDDPSNV